MGEGVGGTGEVVLVLVGVGWAETAAQKGLEKRLLMMRTGAGSLEERVRLRKLEMGMLEGWGLRRPQEHDEGGLGGGWEDDGGLCGEADGGIDE